MIEVKDCKHGTMMYLRNDKWIGKSFHRYGEALEHEVSLIRNFVEEGDVAIDVGANMGAITIPLAQAVGRGKVYAFEPQQYLYYVLCGNIALNSLYNVEAIQRPVYSDSRTILYCPSPLLLNDDGIPLYDHAGFHYGGVYLTPEPRFEHDIKLTSVALDDVIEKVDFIKIDAEGAEIEILKGAAKTIENHKPVMLIEAMPWLAPKIADILKTYGYMFHSCRMPYFNKNNYFENPIDELRESNDKETPMMSSDMICYHESEPQWGDVYFRAMKDLR